MKVNQNAKTVYHTNLLQASITRLSSTIDNQRTLLNNQESSKESLNELVKFAKWNKLEVNALKENDSEILSQIGQIKELIETQNTPLLNIYRKAEDSIIARDKLLFENLYTDFVGREEELDELFEFLEKDQKFSWFMMDGPSGSGKSRLANEVCIRARSNGWNSGFSQSGLNANFEWEKFRPNTHTLIVLDEVHFRKEETKNLLIACNIIGQELSKNSFKIRVLILARNFDDELRNYFDDVQIRNS